MKFLRVFFIGLVAWVSVHGMLGASGRKRGTGRTASATVTRKKTEQPVGRQSLKPTAVVRKSIPVDNKTVETAVKVVWSDFLKTIMIAIEQQKVGDNSTKKRLLDHYLQQAVQRSLQVKKMSAFEQSIFEQVLSTAAVELFNKDSGDGEIADLAASLQFVRWAQDLLANKANIKLVFSYLKKIDQALQRFTLLLDKDPNKALKQLNTRLSSLMDQVWGEEKLSAQEQQQLVDVLDKLQNMFFFFEEEEEELMADEKQSYKDSANRLSRYIALLTTQFTTKQSALIIQRMNRFEKLLFDKPAGLSWCGCNAAPFEKRITLAVRMVIDIMRRHPHKESRIVYTSLAAGSLLQDYLVISTLKQQGYTNIDINFIDLEINDRRALEAMIERAKQEGDEDRQLHAQNMLESALNNAFHRAAFKRKLAIVSDWGAISLTSYEDSSLLTDAKMAVTDIQLTSWKSVNDYLQFVQENPEFKADVVTLVDRNAFVVFSVPDVVDANAVVFSEKAAEEEEEKIEGSMAYGDDSFLDSEKPSLYIPFKRMSGLEIYTNIDQSSSFLLFFDDIIRRIGLDVPFSAELAERIAAIFSSKDMAVDVVWISDLYTALYDIAQGAAKPEALVYILDYIDINPDVSEMQEFTAASFARQPTVISPITKKRLQTKYGYRAHKIDDKKQKQQTLARRRAVLQSLKTQPRGRGRQTSADVLRWVKERQNN